MPLVPVADSLAASVVVFVYVVTQPKITVLTATVNTNNKITEINGETAFLFIISTTIRASAVFTKNAGAIGICFDA